MITGVDRWPSMRIHRQLIGDREKTSGHFALRATPLAQIARGETIPSPRSGNFTIDFTYRFPHRIGGTLRESVVRSKDNNDKMRPSLLLANL
jgi:hypothetical protein